MSSAVPEDQPSGIRPITLEDVPTVVDMVRELAAYERAEHEARMTVEQLTAVLSAPDSPVSGHVAVTPDGELAGFALWFRTFSTWRGTLGIHLEDLYVRPQHRGGGYGRELLRTLAELCVQHGWSRLEWAVLDWNTPAIDFYRSVGAAPQEGWSVFRLTDDALTGLAADVRPTRPHPPSDPTEETQ